MNPKMNLKTASLVSLVVFGSLVTNAEAGATTAQKLETCRAAIEIAYASGDEVPGVRLQAVRKGGKQLKLWVDTPEGEGLSVFCDVDRSSGDLIALDPPHKLAPALAQSQGD